MYKDIFSNERRYRFGLAESPNCVICQQPESVIHQLLECPNAVRMWQLYKDITGLDIATIDSLVCPVFGLEFEVVKSIILKALIQIDRSKDLSILGLKSLIKHQLIIERICTANSGREVGSLTDLISKCC
jgi:hypothetical protein